MDATDRRQHDREVSVTAASHLTGATAGPAGWLVATAVGVLIAWLVSAASFGILTFAGLFLGAFFTGRVAGARAARHWVLASLLTVGGFTLLWIQARQGAI